MYKYGLGGTQEKAEYRVMEWRNKKFSLITILHYKRLYCNVLQVSNIIKMLTLTLTIVLKQAVFLANHCNITLSKEMLPLLHRLGDFSLITNACVSTRNLTDTYV